MSNKQVPKEMADNRRQVDPASLEILIYRMDELKSQNSELKSLFMENTAKQESRVNQIEARLSNLESWRAAQQAIEALVKSDNIKGKNDSLLNDKLIQIILAILAILAAVLGLNVGGFLR